MTSQLKQKPLLAQLDVVRGFAILSVFIFHIYGATFGMDKLPFLGNFRDYSKAPDLAFLIFWPYQYGLLGVTLFFVLSGFCIHLSFLKYINSLEDRGLDFQFKTYIKDFFVRRIFRIFPAYLLALLILSFIYQPTKIDIETSEGSFQFFSHLFLVHNFSKDSFFGINPVFWSIAVEMQLYCIYPLLLIIRKHLGIAKTVLAIFIFQYFYGQLGWDLDLQINELGKSWQNPFMESLQIFRQMPFNFWFTWAAGAYLAEHIYVKDKKILNLSLPYKLLFLSLYVLGSLYKPVSALGHYSSIVLFVSLLEDYIFDRQNLNSLERAIANIGLCSYSVYLFHQPIVVLLVGLLSKTFNPYFLCTVGAVLMFIPVFGISWLIYKYVEIPTHRAGKNIARQISSRDLQTYGANKKGVKSN
jgi:peptidoglycan/LPS O-acetylase OafA/YrhL